MYFIGGPSNAKGSLWAIQPVNWGDSVPRRSSRTQRNAAPGPPHSHLSVPPTRNEQPRSLTSTGTVPTDWYASITTWAPTALAFLQIAFASWM